VTERAPRPTAATGDGPKFERSGMAREMRRQGHNVVGITSAGRRALAQAGITGKRIELPESRHARSVAGERTDGFRQQVRAALDETHRLLDTEPSDTWFGLAGRLETGGCPVRRRSRWWRRGVMVTR
jgi:hypothetical protein